MVFNFSTIVITIIVLTASRVKGEPKSNTAINGASTNTASEYGVETIDSIMEKLKNTSLGCRELLNFNQKTVRSVLLVSQTSFPRNLTEMDDHCKLGLQLSKGFKRYGKCLLGFAKQTLQILSHGIRNFVKSTCNSQQAKEAALINLRCATPESIHGWTKCADLADRQLRYVAENSTGERLVADLCCIAADAKSCVANGTGTIKGCHEKADTSKFLQGILNSVLKELNDFVCGRFKNRGDCKRYNPEGLRQLRGIEREVGSSKDGLLIMPVLKVAIKLTSEDEETGEDD